HERAHAEGRMHGMAPPQFGCTSLIFRHMLTISCCALQRFLGWCYSCAHVLGHRLPADQNLIGGVPITIISIFVYKALLGFAAPNRGS
ncbi:MAG: hypothetical protein ACKPKO_40180, partial [Candidatus Fonsibacter sp.]